MILVPEKMLTISYREPGLANPTIWRGEPGQGGTTFNLKRESRADNTPGNATMHYISFEPRLEGFWDEGSYSGCWWIDIDEEPDA